MAVGALDVYGEQFVHEGELLNELGQRLHGEGPFIQERVQKAAIVNEPEPTRAPWLRFHDQRLLVSALRLTVVPGVSLAQLCHAARAADPAAPYGLSLRTSLLASIVHSGALSNIISCFMKYI